MQIRSLLMAMVALSMTACGGGGGGGADEPATREGREISKARLIAKADAICRQDEARLVARLKALPKSRVKDRRSAQTEVIAPIFALYAETILAGVRKIAALGRPSADADLLDDYLDERATAGNALRDAATAAREGDAAALRVATETFGRNQAQALGKRFGFRVCGLGAVQGPLQSRR